MNLTVRRVVAVLATVAASVTLAAVPASAAYTQDLSVCGRRYYNWPGSEGSMFTPTNPDGSGFRWTIKRAVPNNSACDDVVVRYDDLFNADSGASVPYNFAPCAAFAVEVSRADGRKVYRSATICQGGIETLWSDIGDGSVISVRSRQTVWQVADHRFVTKITVWA